MNMKLLRRIEALERKLLWRKSVPPLVVVYRLDPERTLGPNERIVEDWFEDHNNLITARERITSDPEDVGRRCPRNGCLEDVKRGMEEELRCDLRQEGPSTIGHVVSLRT